MLFYLEESFVIVVYVQYDVVGVSRHNEVPESIKSILRNSVLGSAVATKIQYSTIILRSNTVHGTWTTPTVDLFTFGTGINTGYNRRTLIFGRFGHASLEGEAIISIRCKWDLEEINHD